MTHPKYDGKRYIYDSLYGQIYLPEWMWKVIISPELQRLREVRLCNINSLCLPGGANINRYEHAIGTCYLASLSLDSWPFGDPLSEDDKKMFMLAALLHDIITAPFGHSIEYVESKEGFEHERAFEYVVLKKQTEQYKYRYATYEDFYWGMPGKLYETLSSELKLSDNQIRTIGEYISGKGRFGPLISGSIDLDNVDNVFRLAYHIGLYRRDETPQNIAKSLWTESGKIIIFESSTHLIDKWYQIRKNLYEYLLLNPEEFSAKCMLTNAIELGKKEKSIPFRWNDTDYKLLENLSGASSDISVIVGRLMTGDLYGCIAIYSSTRTDKYSFIQNVDFRNNLENELSDLVKPEASIKIDELPIEFKNSIKGIAGIKYDDQTKVLKISTDFSENAKQKLIENESEFLRNTILNLSKNASEKHSKFGIKSPMIAIHPIQDKNKTMRQIQISTSGGKIVEIGNKSNKLLIGIFFKNKALNMINIARINKENFQNIKNELKNYLSKVLEDPNIEELELYGESEI